MLSELFYKRLYQAAAWMNLIIIGFHLLLYGNIEIKDLDLWLHLATGRYILEHFSVPTVDILSHTMASQPWNNHEWLFQIIITYTHQFFGVEGWIGLRLILLFLIFFHLWTLGYDNKRPFWPVVLLILTVLNFQSRFFLRPEMFSVLFFTLYIFILNAHLDNKKSLFLLVCLQVLWVNMHGFFIFGILLTGIFLLAEYLKRYAPLPQQWRNVSRLTDQEFQNLKFILIGICAACFVNPNFIEGAIYPLRILYSSAADHTVFFEFIYELRKPIVWDTLFSWHPHLYYRWMIIIPIVSFILNRRHLDVGIFILWFLFLVFSLSAERNIAFYSLVAYLVTLINLRQFKWEHVLPIQIKDKRFIYCLATLCLLGTGFWMFHLGDHLLKNGYFDYDQMRRKSEYGGVSQRNFPHKAVDFLVEHKLKGNIFNDFNSGAFLLGKTHPSIRTFIDGRTELYGPDFFKNYREIMKGDEGLLAEALDQYQITIAFLNAVYEDPSQRLVGFFDRREDWQLVYFDHDALIYLKKTEQNQAIIQETLVDLAKWKLPDLDPYAQPILQRNPFPFIRRAQSLIHLREFDAARAELERASFFSAQNSDVYKLYGQIALFEKEYEAAYRSLRQALLIQPSNYKARYDFAKALYSLGKWDQAQRELHLILKKYPRFLDGYFYLGCIKLAQTSMEEALPLFQKAQEVGKGRFAYFFRDVDIEPSLRKQIQEALDE